MHISVRSSDRQAPAADTPGCPTTIHGLLESSARSFPAATAIIHGGNRSTYAEIDLWASRFASHLVNNGLKAGERVILLSENNANYVVAYYGILKAGGVVVALSTEIKPNGLQALLDEIAPTHVIASARCSKTLAGCTVLCSSLRSCIIAQPSSGLSSQLQVPVTPLEEILENGDPAPLPPVGKDALAAIVYTSGSTGKPKGVMLTHRNIVANTLSICQYLELTSSDIQMVVLPFFYVMGISLLNTHIAVGGAVVINNQFAYPAAVIREMIAERVTGFSGVPSTFAYLLHRSPLAASRDQLTSLRYVSQAGGHMARRTKEDLRAALPAHTKIFIMYGATEASARLTYLDPARYHDKMDSIGKEIPGVTIRIIGDNGNEVAAEEIGEIVAAGENIMQGYWKDDHATRLVIDHNGYHTGDMGYRDKEGFIFITGRKDNQLKVGGHRINPQEIEDALIESGKLIEVAVLGIPDSLLGYRLRAIGVGVTEETQENEILAFCAQRLPVYKRPDRVVFIRTLPKNASGKIDRAASLAMLMAQQAGKMLE